MSGSFLSYQPSSYGKIKDKRKAESDLSRFRKNYTNFVFKCFLAHVCNPLRLRKVTFLKLKEFIKASKLKPWDFIIVIILIIASFIPTLIFGLQQTDAPVTTKVAVLRVDGKEIKTFKLFKGQIETYRYEDPDGDYNLIEVKDDKIRIKEANCGDQVCVRRGWAKKNGETIVCLPHKLVIEVQGQNSGGDGDDLIY